jgi:hypothetical protein
VFAGGEGDGFAEGDGAGVDDAVVEAVDGTGERLAVEGELEDAVVDGFGESGGEVVGVVGGDGEGEFEDIAGGGSGPPEVGVAAPCAIAVGFEVLGGGGAGFLEDFEGFSFEDGGGGRGCGGEEG